MDSNDNKICDTDETQKEENVEKEVVETPIKTSQEEFIKKFMNNVVTIETDFGGGSGFWVDNKGYVITNHHVIQGYENSEKNVTVNSYDSGHSSPYKAKVIGYDFAHDIAVLKVDSNRKWDVFSFAKDIKVGDVVYALGSPLKFDFSASKGIISAKGRGGINDKEVKSYLQTDAPINPGNSGGPLINEKGEVVGLNTWKMSGISVEGLGFALEPNKIQELYTNIRYIADTYKIPILNEISQEDYNEKIKLSIPEFQVIWDKNNGKGNFLSFNYNAQNKDSKEYDMCFNVTIIKGGLIIANKILDKKLKLKTASYQPSPEPVEVNLPFEKDGNYFFEVSAVNCDSKEVYSKNLLTKAYYKKDVVLLTMKEGDSEVVFGRIITIEKLKYTDEKSYSITIKLGDVERVLQSGYDNALIGDIEVDIEKINSDYVTLKISY